ncbi:hypothetical protein FLA_0375 [Filimonas lacunae]|nr:hypothetical protein FLA_0375 [Filimonas lacunae]
MYFIPVVVIVAGIVFSVIINKRHKSAKAEINIDQERKLYSLYKTELLNQDFAFLQKWMKDKPIDAFSTASSPQSTANKVQQFIGDGVKNVALSTVGVRVQRVETDAFWVLSGKELHLLSADTEGDLEEHLIFNESRIANAQLQNNGVLKTSLGFYAKQAEEYLPKVHTITFDVDGKPLSLEIHDRLKYIPTTTEMWNQQKNLQTRAKYQVVGEHFLEELKSRYPHLAIVKQTV